MTLRLIEPVTDEPVTLEAAKLALRIDGNALDDDLTAALIAARAEAEHFAGCSFAPQQWRLARRDWWLGGLTLPRGPIDDVLAVSYLDPESNWQTVDPSNYTLDGEFLYMPFDFDPPRTLQRDGSVRVDYTAGTWFGDSNGNNLPTDIQRAIILLAQSTFDSLSEQPHTLRERAFAVLRPYRLNHGMVSA